MISFDVVKKSLFCGSQQQQQIWLLPWAVFCFAFSSCWDPQKNDFLTTSKEIMGDQLSKTKQNFTARLYCPGQWLLIERPVGKILLTSAVRNYLETRPAKLWLRPLCFALGPPSILQTSFPNNFFSARPVIHSHVLVHVEVLMHLSDGTKQISLVFSEL